MTSLLRAAFRPVPWLAALALLCLAPAGGARTGEIEPGEKAPLFRLDKAGGGQITSADIAGKVTLINFWATWCAPCVREMPHLDTAYEKYRARDFLIIGVNYQQDEKRVLGFLNKIPVSFPMALDTTGEFSRMFGVNALPVSVLIDQEGSIVKKLVGNLSIATLEKWLGETLTR